MKASLILGEALQEMDKLIAAGVKVDAVITDPPYGTTDCKWDEVIPFEAMWERLDKLTKPNAAIVLFGAEPFSSKMRLSNIENYKYDWIWHKVNTATGFLNAKKQPLRNNELVSVFYQQQCTYNPQMRTGFKAYSTKRYAASASSIYGGVKKDSTTVSNGERHPTTVLEFKRDGDRQHPTQKPISLMSYLIKTYTNEGETVLDFTMGSGSTGEAAIKNHRKFIGIEMDEKYYKIAKKRCEGDLFS